MVGYLASLPHELLVVVFQFLSPEDLCSKLACVSKFFLETVKDGWLWRHFCKSQFQIHQKLYIIDQDQVQWREEYLLMKDMWKKLVVDNGLRAAAQYEKIVRIDNENKGEAGPLFEALIIVYTPLTVQSKQPLLPLPFGDFTMGYYELTLVAKGPEQIIGLGLAPNEYVEGMPGWRRGSIGYHADDGKLFLGRGQGTYLTDPWQVGDVVGCGFDFARKRAFFTKNGILLGQYEIIPKEYLYATLGARSIGEKAMINFGKKPFAFNLLRYQLENYEDSTPLDYPVHYTDVANYIPFQPNEEYDIMDELDYL